MSATGIIAAGDRQTAEAGALILGAGGNAIDAVCAAGFASFVTEPPLTSPAGAGMLLHGHPQRGFRCLDFFATMPGLGGAPRSLDFRPVVVNFGDATQTFHIGRGAAAVPGALLGLYTAHTTWGRLPLSEIVAPAVQLARGGFTVSAQIAHVMGILAPILTSTAESRALYEIDGQLAQAGATLRNPALADFLEALACNPSAALRDLQATLVSHLGPARGGLLSDADLSAYQPVQRAPLALDLGPYRVLTPPPPSSGGSLVSFGLRLAAHLHIEQHPFGSPAHTQAVLRVLSAISALRQQGFDEVVADRGRVEALLADPDLERWITPPPGAEPGFGSTTHISVLDDHGGAAALTTTNGEGSGHVLPGLGIHVNNLLGEEDINPRGWHAEPPGTWMTTMMTPTIVLEQGAPRLVLGSGGSNRIRSAILQTLLATLAFGRPLQDAIHAPRLHLEGDRLWYEAVGLSPASDALLREHPDAIRFPERHMFFGGVHTVAREGDALVGCGDPRRDGAVARSF